MEHAPPCPPTHTCTQDGGVCSITGHAGLGEGEVHTHTKLSYPGTQGNKEIVQGGSGGSGGRRLEAETSPTVGGADWHNSYFSAIGEGAQSEGWRREGRRSPTSLGAKSGFQIPQGKGLAGVGEGQGGSSGHPPPSALPNAVTVSPSHLSGQQQPWSQYLQVIQRADPPHPSFTPSLGFGRFSRGWVGRREPPRQTLPSLPPTSQTTGLGPQRFLTSALAPPGSRLQKAGATTIRGEGAALFLIPPS